MTDPVWIYGTDGDDIVPWREALADGYGVAGQAECGGAGVTRHDH